MHANAPVIDPFDFIGDHDVAMLRRWNRKVILHSQEETGQDRWVLELLNGKEQGVFLELGGFDGVYHSNTLTLENHFGWTGWLIEAIPEYAEKARETRRCQVITAAIGPDYGTQQYYLGGQWSGLKDLTRPNLVPGHIEYQNPIIDVATAPLQDVLRSLRVPSVIDYFSIDVEGAEFAILKSYFESAKLDRLPAIFRCLSVEVGIHADDLHSLWALLQPFGYELSHVRAWEAFFYHKELCRA